MDRDQTSVYDPPGEAEEELALQRGEADILAGRVIAHADVVRWLESWGTDQELPPPTWRK